MLARKRYFFLAFVDSLGSGTRQWRKRNQLVKSKGMRTKSRITRVGLCALALGVCVAAQAAASVITNITLIGSNPCLGIRSDVGVINRVQCSTNLGQTNWVVVTNLVVSQSGYEFVHTTPPAGPARFYRVVACPTNAPAGMALIPAGFFSMGDALDGETNAVPIHTVYLSAFYLDRNLVSKTLWDQVYQWETNNGYTFEYYGFGKTNGLGKAANHPVQTVTWYDAVKWCNARAEKEGLPLATTPMRLKPPFIVAAGSTSATPG